MKSDEKKTEFQILQELFEDQRAGARDPNHPIHDRLKASLKAQQERLDKNKKPQSKD
jgi:DNA-binding Lrp family transcriptional regulator